MKTLSSTLALLSPFLCGSVLAAEIDFNRDVRPILSDKCFQCHGPDADAREADLRLDQRKDALAAIEPGDPAASELFARIVHDDPDLRMPPADAAKQLTKHEIDTLRQWIVDGAEFAGHWSFQPIVQPDVPDLADDDWSRNEIDRFILRRLQTEGLTPSSEAEPRTLLRRVTLDLTGLPPTPDEYAEFLANPDLDAAIDRLMKSPRYGEHMA